MVLCSLVTMSRGSVVKLMWLGGRAADLLYGHSPRPLHTSSQPRAGFKPEKVAVVTKTTRYEFEQQRYRFAGLSEEDLKQLVSLRAELPVSLQTHVDLTCTHAVPVFQLAMKGSSYSGLLERHNIHTNNVEHVVKCLR